MILAAGRGERLRPLTDTTPKPLLEAGGAPLIVHVLRALAREGFHDIVINVAWLAERIVAALGGGEAFGVRIAYSHEPAGALGTGGGIRHALPLLGDAPFVAVNSDLWTDYPFGRLRDKTERSAHVVLTGNPPHHPCGDFGLRNGLLDVDGANPLTYCGIGVYSPAFFSGAPHDPFELAGLLRRGAGRAEVSAEHYSGLWRDIGTGARLRELRAMLAQRS